MMISHSHEKMSNSLGHFSRASKAPKIPIYDDDDFFNKEVKLSLSKALSILNPYSVTLKTNCKQPHLM